MKKLLRQKWFWGALGILAGFVGLVVLSRLLPVPAPFQLKEVVIPNPPAHLNETELVRLTGVRKGDNLLTLSLKKVRDRLKKFPWIEEVALAKGYPGRLVVSVKEQEAVALLKSDSLYLVNRKGVVFKKLAAGDPRNFPVLTGEALPVASLVDLVASFQKRELLRGIGLSEIHWDKRQGVSLFTVKPVAKVTIGKERWEERLDKLVRLFPEIVVSAKRTPASIDLTYEKRVFVKQKNSYLEVYGSEPGAKRR